MIVEQIWTANNYRNFNYLIVDPDTGEALAVDPLDHQKCLAAAKAHGWTITQILNTHHHRDHTGGNDQVVAATHAKLAASSLLPVPFHRATSGYMHSGRVRSSLPAVLCVAIILSGAAPFSTHCSSAVR